MVELEFAELKNGMMNGGLLSYGDGGWPEPVGVGVGGAGVGHLA